MSTVLSQDVAMSTLDPALLNSYKQAIREEVFGSGITGSNGFVGLTSSKDKILRSLKWLAGDKSSKVSSKLKEKTDSLNEYFEHPESFIPNPTDEQMAWFRSFFRETINTIIGELDLPNKQIQKRSHSEEDTARKKLLSEKLAIEQEKEQDLGNLPVGAIEVIDNLLVECNFRNANGRVMTLLDLRSNPLSEDFPTDKLSFIAENAQKIQNVQESWRIRFRDLKNMSLDQMKIVFDDAKMAMISVIMQDCGVEFYQIALSDPDYLRDLLTFPQVWSLEASTLKSLVEAESFYTEQAKELEVDFSGVINYAMKMQNYGIGDEQKEEFFTLLGTIKNSRRDEVLEDIGSRNIAEATENIETFMSLRERGYSGVKMLNLSFDNFKHVLEYPDAKSSTVILESCKIANRSFSR